MGVKNVQMEELYSLEPEVFENIRPVYGLIFLFKWKDEEQAAKAPTVDPYDYPNVFFANQVRVLA